MKTLSHLAAAGVLATCVAAASPVSAADGFALTPGPLRAGPSTEYPVVGRLSRGESVVVHGCVARYRWCDISAVGERGWFPGARIAFERGGRRVALPAVAGLVGLSIIGFSLGDYWGAHYRQRPWYEDRRWRHGPGGPRPPRDRRPSPGVDPRPGGEVHAPPHHRPPRLDPRPARPEMRPPRDHRPFPPPSGAPRMPRHEGAAGSAPRSGGMPGGGMHPRGMPGIGGPAQCGDACR